MKFIAAAILTLVFAYFLRDSIKKHGKYYYIGALAISLFTIFADTSGMPAVVETISSTFFRYGTVGTAMISLVMYTNAFKNGSFIQKTFMPIRAELSIIACLLIYGHNFSTGQTYVTMFLSVPERMTTATIVALFMTLLLMLMMTPLFITSFKPIRKKMKAKNWKMLQRLAYPYYMLIYVHIMLLMLPLAVAGNPVYIIDIVVYSILFLGYATLRLYKYYQKSKNKIALALIGGMYVLFVVALAMNMVDTTPAVAEAPVATTVVNGTTTTDAANTATAAVETEGSAEVEATQPTAEVAEPEATAEVAEPEATAEATEPESTAEVAEPEATAEVAEPEPTAEVVEPEVEEVVVEVEFVPSSKYDLNLSAIPDGVYSGKGYGYDGYTKVTVTMAGGAIQSITLDSYADDEDYMASVDWLPDYMVSQQTVDVDVVSGATYSSLGIKDAVLDALT